MGRTISNNRKENRITYRIMSDCMREFIEDAALSESIHLRRQVSMSHIINGIIRKNMQELGWECD